MTQTVLMIAEKPSLAESIAKILSGGKFNSRRSLACNVFEYSGRFMGKDDVKFKVTSVMGHVFSLDFPKEYNNWGAVEPIELYDAPVVKLESNPKVEGKNVDSLVLWLDCDREGENICFEVLKVVQPNMNKSHNSKRKNVYRAKFSAITPVEIKGAMAKLGTPDANQAKAVDVRQELDLKIGCAFTRFQTKYFQGKYGNLDSALVSFGPCQTPTLALCVKRHDEILSHVPKKFWTLTATILVSNEPLKLACERGRMFEKKKAVDIRESIKNTQSGKIIKVAVDRKSLQRPAALNTVEMLKSASVGLGMSPQSTMHVAERLYMSGYISYPRTETTRYPASFDFKSVLKDLSSSPNWGAVASELHTKGFTHPEGGKDVGDHPPITPTSLGTEYELSGDTWRLYDYICRHFLASLSPNCKYNRVTLSVQIQQEVFSVSGKQVVSPGFTEIMPWKDPDEESPLPSEIDKMLNEQIKVSDVVLKEGETSPPDYLTESDLISLMEKLGIGTDASMAVHIANICNRRYVSVQGNKRFMIPSDLGIVLIHGYQKIDPALALPTLRSEMEKKISLIADGKAEDQKMLDEELAIYVEKFKNFTQKVYL